ncbi:MAG: L,D-transpeptidase [bacterium]|nr:L,D-transpeptidase [bacterium]
MDFRKVLLFVILIGGTMLLISNKFSYSFFKRIFQVNLSDQAGIQVQEKAKIEDIEDMIYIPEVKNFKEYFLKKINSSAYIEIVIPENILYLYRWNGKANTFDVFRKYPVSIGKSMTQTPIGEGVIYTKGHILFKYLYGPLFGQVVTIGHDEFGGEFQIPYESMFGLYMIVNQTDRYVIHSTTEYWTTGQAVSGGCVRLLIPDMLELYPFIEPPIRVRIKYQVFNLEKELLTIYPDVYRKYTNLYNALLDFFRSHNINPIIFDQDKIKKALFGDLPETISLNDILDEYFVKKNVMFKDIRLEYENFLSEDKDIKINAFTIPNK